MARCGFDFLRDIRYPAPWALVHSFYKFCLLYSKQNPVTILNPFTFLGENLCPSQEVYGGRDGVDLLTSVHPWLLNVK